MANTPPAREPEEASDSIGDLVHFAVIFALSFAPATVATLFPEGALEDKNQAFLLVYLVTLPLAAAATLVFIGLANDWFGAGDGVKPLVWIALIIFCTSLLATGTAPTMPGSSDVVTSYADAANQVAHPIGKLFAVVLYAIFAYASIYGWPLFIAGILVGGYVGYLLDKWMFASDRRAAIPT
jgi:hypothetical protein